MDAHTAAEVEEWEPVSFSGGYRGLHELAASEFSGVVESGAATLYMVMGRVVAIDGGTIQAFETGGTARGAPHSSLPMLYAMRARGGRTRASYYTEDTPIPNVDQTLREGGFTGYIELAENVLSGDYYVVYQGGRSTGVAFIGQSRRVVTGQEAYDRACDEVGIYEVNSVDLEVIEIPGEPPEEDDGSDVAGAATGTGATDAEDRREPPTNEDGGGARRVTDEEAVGANEGADEIADAPGGPEPARTEGSEAGDEEGVGPGEASDATTGDDTGEVTGGTVAGLDESDVQPVPSVDPNYSARAESPTESGTAGGTGESAPGESATEETADQEATTEGVTDEETAVPEETNEGGTDLSASPTATETPSGATTGGEAAPDADIGESEAVQQELRQELTATREQNDQLAARVKRLEARIEELSSREAAGEESSAGPDLSTAEALSGTNLFVRYHSKARPTLEDAHAGAADAEGVRENLRIEYHTQFEDEGATVDGRPFQAWLIDRPERTFLAWLVEDVLFEIRATGSVEAMRKLYSAIPEIDRVELDTTIRVEDVAGEGNRDVGFDLVARGPKGNPLVVADIESSREPTTGDALASLVTDATDLVAVDDTLAGAFFVTASYFEPNALATAEDATGGSLLSRDKRTSFVKHTRKRGYHLCLVERREGNFHLKQPDL